jgi:Ni/Fe-hydrogenase 1 B-type cytochrome subunit
VVADKRHFYEWNAAFRIDHWVRVLAVSALTLTGFYIHGPWGSGGENVMATMRFWHFAASYVLVLGLAVRVYLAFRSRFSPDWQDFRVVRNLRNVPDVLKYYLFLGRTHKDYGRYNPMQALTYLSWVFLILFMAVTGCALYRGSVFGLFQAQDGFGWVSALLGGEANVRLLHYFGMWAFLVTVAIHVYMAVMMTFVNRDHTFRSMFSGFKLKAIEPSDGSREPGAK